MNFCDFCTCDDCREGRSWLWHAQTEDGRWICDVCYHYEVCLDAKGRRKGTEKNLGPCDNLNCEHRPKLVTEWSQTHIADLEAELRALCNSEG